MNRISLQATKFENVPQGTVMLGYRMYDDYSQVYDNTWEEMATVPDDLEFLEKVMKESINDEVGVMLDSMMEHEKGIEINGTYYDWDEVSHLWDRVT